MPTRVATRELCDFHCVSPGRIVTSGAQVQHYQPAHYTQVVQTASTSNKIDRAPLKHTNVTNPHSDGEISTNNSLHPRNVISSLSCKPRHRPAGPQTSVFPLYFHKCFVSDGRVLQRRSALQHTGIGGMVLTHAALRRLWRCPRTE